MPQQSFLLLQGVASPFFKHLQDALIQRQCKVTRINFCGGDFFYSGKNIFHDIFSTATININFTGKLDNFPVFLTEIIAERNITDIILFGDMRPVHSAAIKLANACQIHIHVIEEGYLRPHWFTLERNGTNANSTLYPPKAANYYLKNLEQTASNTHTSPQSLENISNSLTVRALHDILYQLANAFMKPLFPYYRTHRIYTPLQEYLGWMKRMPLNRLYHQNIDKAVINTLFQQKTSYYFFPLQLNSDMQIQQHSCFSSIESCIDNVLASFSQYASGETKLIIKNHPLDPGISNYKTRIKKLAKKYRINETRIIYLETGDLPKLLDSCLGVIVINSTVGISALEAGKPVMCLGQAIYNIQGLCFQGRFDEFWEAATDVQQQPDKLLFKAFKQTLLQQNQITGNLYQQPGIGIGVANCLNSLINTSATHEVVTKKTNA